MIIVIRGHIRSSFNTNELYNFVLSLHKIFPDLKIFIHTWDIYANNLSWRHINVNNTQVTEKVIYDYFRELSRCIKHIIIDNDKNIKIIGTVTGTINNGIMPILGWKNYWYGKYKIIDYIYNQNLYNNETIINSRFDILDNSNKFDKDTIFKFIIKNSNINFTKNVFMFNHECNGIDNIYIGNINTMYKLSNMFYYNLDNILLKNNDTIHQERLVFRINSTLIN